MSTQVKDGGAAFPHCFEDAAGNPRWRQSTGISIRDWFAGKAIQGFCAGAFWAEVDNDEAAKAAYDLADALLRARGADHE